MSVEYPDEPVDGFPTPPRTVTDREGREIELTRADGDTEDLVEMYLDFEEEDRAQGIPPTKEPDIREWLDAVMTDDGLNVIARNEGNAVGHVMLVSDSDGAYELAIFVLQPYQGAGIGTALVETALGAAAEEGIDRVWLSVERWNKPAVNLYEKIGFQSCGGERFERMMALRLA
ncbi:GNAT family N-acetyltransferase [Halovenus sp. WSH3]|uniref:GNAT family N-acetyltransferase n=1 Tax=Halovenus carboxidivorans TaxID=2692199 RepID=A0A6B0THN3_9EURY|nr:GNAT family N-acetyltransferase [Halovenus carboxidivorans]MXR52699.1 GNAT family N-acetyltransferase [Halovenus carboxidivorans]